MQGGVFVYQWIILVVSYRHMLDTIRFFPKHKSPMWDSPESEAILEMFEEGCRGVILGEIRDVKEVVEKICNLDTSLKSKHVSIEMKHSIADVSKMAGVIPDIDGDIEDLLENEKKRIENIGQIRRGATALFLGTIRTMLKRPEVMLKMKPTEIALWFKMIRDEEDSERKIELKKRESDREDAKLKLMFFRAASGAIGLDEIKCLQDDLRQDLTNLINGGRIQFTPETPAEAPYLGES